VASGSSAKLRVLEPTYILVSQHHDSVKERDAVLRVDRCSDGGEKWHHRSVGSSKDCRQQKVINLY